MRTLEGEAVKAPIPLASLIICLCVVSTSVAGRVAIKGPAQTSAGTEAEAIRRLERERLRALVAADMQTARPIHADDFQLVNPAAVVSTKEQYLGQIERGELDYLVWEPKEIVVRWYGDAAVLRYESFVDLIQRPKGQPEVRVKGVHWHTDLYEKRNGRWQVFWSHASRVRQ
jgi:hypothetical protein